MATLIQAWKLAWDGNTAVPVVNSFNLATLIQAWKLKLHKGYCEIYVYSFNLATLIQAWKLRSLIPRWHASGKLQFGHAHSSVETSEPEPNSHRTRKRFNLATLIQAWKLGCWLGCVDGLDSASIWPRSFKRGNYFHSPRWHIQGSTLQFGHAHSSVETTMMAFAGCRVEEVLQFGHAHSSVETRLMRFGPCGYPTSFNLATLIQAWKQCRRPPNRTMDRASFNLATLIQAWKHGVGEKLRTLDEASIWPRSFKRGNNLQSDPFILSYIRFNLATLIQAWKPDALDKPLDYFRELQFGHAHSSVETR